MSEYKGCDKCKYDGKGQNEYPCNKCMHNAEDWFEPMTNADRIRNMNIAELKIFIERAIYCGGLISEEKSSSLCQGCQYPFCQDIEKWLQAEVEGDSNGET